jgi:hypothetical protein
VSGVLGVVCIVRCFGPSCATGNLQPCQTGWGQQAGARRADWGGGGGKGPSIRQELPPESCGGNGGSTGCGQSRGEEPEQRRAAVGGCGEDADDAQRTERSREKEVRPAYR